jgi:hypothetical protein
MSTPDDERIGQEVESDPDGSTPVSADEQEPEHRDVGDQGRLPHGARRDDTT